MSLSWRFTLPLCLLPAFALASTPFTSPEHVMIGNKVKLHFVAQDSGKQNVVLHLPNGLKMTYGEIVTMPDFYGQPEIAISQGKSEPARKARFLDAYNSFAIDAKSADEAKSLLDAVYAEKEVVDQGIKNGEKPNDIYEKIGHEFDRQYNCITGGGCDIDTWYLSPGRYLNILNDKSNYDHFGNNAEIAYKVGHQLALEQAALAHKTADTNKLETAYAINAFACHFLTDRFASGHMRTPRAELAETVTPATVGALLASYMHSEENTSGLHVHNLRGDRWVAYGDKAYFYPDIKIHLAMIQETMQHSADEIFAAYQQGDTLVADTVSDLIPYTDETGDTGTQDISPLFYKDINTLTIMRRSDMSDLRDRNWTSSWWGWSTLIELQRARGTLTLEAQAMLARSELAEKAVQSGLITKKEFIEYVKAKR